MSSDRDTIRIDRFDGTNFGYWKMQMEDHLYQRDLYLPLGEMPKDHDKAAWDLLDRKALGEIRTTLSRTLAFNIKGHTTTRGLMAALSDMYEQPSAANKVHLIKKLFNLKMPENGNFKEHMNNFNEIVDQLASVSISFEDEIRALLILSELPKSWDGTVTSISSSFGKSKMRFQDVINLIMTEEIRKREGPTSSSGAALQLEGRGRGKKKGQGLGRS